MKNFVASFLVVLLFWSSEASAKKGEVAVMADGTFACVEKGGGAIITGPTGKWRTSTPTTVGNECETINRAINPSTQYFEGFRFETRFGYVTRNMSDDQGAYEVGNGVSYGIETGYDFAIGNGIVAGAYATYDFSSVDRCDAAHCVGENGNFGIGGRVGIVAAPNLLLYGKLGYARARMDAEIVGFPAALVGNVQVSDDVGGIQGALGINVGLGKRLYGMAELNYGGYADFLEASLQRRQIAVGIGVRF